MLITTPGDFAKFAAQSHEKTAADVDSWTDYLRAMNPFAVAMEAPSGERMSRQLGGWAKGLGGAALGGGAGLLGGRELGALAGGAFPEQALKASELMNPALLHSGILGRHALPRPTGILGGLQLLGTHGLSGLKGMAGGAAGAGLGLLGGAPVGAALGGLGGHVSGIRAARAARLEQEAAERVAREAAERAALSGGSGALSELAERAMAAARRNPLMAGLGAGALGAAALA